MPLPLCGLQYAKIIATVDKETGRVNNYNWSIARDNQDFFANPEDRKKYFVLTVKNLRCDSIPELQAKFEAAKEYLEADFLGNIKDMAKGLKRVQDINQKGLMGYEKEIRVHWRVLASPLAHGKWVDQGLEFLVNSSPQTAQYKLRDHVMLQVENWSQPLWVFIKSCHGDEYIGRRVADPNEVVQFSSKHVFDHRSRTMAH